MLQDKILNDLRNTVNTIKKGILKVIVGELQREKTKTLSDDQVISIIKKLIKYEEDRLSKCLDKPETSSYLESLKKYLPQQASEEDIKLWINCNVDFSILKNKNQAIGLVTKHFGSQVDGNLIKDIIMRCYA